MTMCIFDFLKTGNYGFVQNNDYTVKVMQKDLNFVLIFDQYKLSSKSVWSVHMITRCLPWNDDGKYTYIYNVSLNGRKES